MPSRAASSAPRTTRFAARLVACAFAAWALSSCGAKRDVQRPAVAPPAPGGFALRAGGTGADGVSALVLDSAGNLIVAGTFTDATLVGERELTAVGGRDAFLAKFTSSGTALWAIALGSPGSDQITSLAVAGRNDLIVAGSFLESIDLGGGALESAGGNDIFVARFDATGAHVWSRAIGGPQFDGDARVAVDAAGDVVLVGSFSGTMELAGQVLASAGLADIFITRLSGTDGTPRDATAFGGAGDDGVGATALMRNGSVVVGGSFTDTLPFSPTPMESVGDSDAFIFKVRR